MTNTQNTNHFETEINNSYSGSNTTLDNLVTDMVSYSGQLESAIEDDAETAPVTTLRASEFKTRIDGLDTTTPDATKTILHDFLTYIIVFEHYLHYSVNAFQQSASLTSASANQLVQDARKKGKSKIPPAASLPPRPRPTPRSTNLDLVAVRADLNSMSSEFAPALYDLMIAFLDMLDILEKAKDFLVANRQAIEDENSTDLSGLAREMVIYVMTFVPDISGVSTPQVYTSQLSTPFNTSLSSLQSSMDTSLYSEFQAFLSYIGSLEN